MASSSSPSLKRKRKSSNQTEDISSISDELKTVQMTNGVVSQMQETISRRIESIRKLISKSKGNDGLICGVLSELDGMKHDVHNDIFGPIRQLENEGKNQSAKLKRLYSCLTCNICNEALLTPYTIIECGHVFCLECLKLWFNQQCSCPKCRQKVYQGPIPVYLIREMASEFVDKIPNSSLEITGTGMDGGKKDVWEGRFRRAQDGAIIDYEDGVMRCPNCGWEIEASECGNPNCDAVFDHETIAAYMAENFVGPESESSLSSEELVVGSQEEEEDLSFVVSDNVVEYETDAEEENDDDDDDRGDVVENVNVDENHGGMEEEEEDEDEELERIRRRVRRRSNLPIIISDSSARSYPRSRLRRQVIISDDESGSIEWSNNGDSREDSRGTFSPLHTVQSVESRSRSTSTSIQNSRQYQRRRGGVELDDIFDEPQLSGEDEQDESLDEDEQDKSLDEDEEDHRHVYLDEYAIEDNSDEDPFNGEEDNGGFDEDPNTGEYEDL